MYSDQSNHLKNVEMNLNENFAIFFFVAFSTSPTCIFEMKANENWSERDDGKSEWK